MPNRTGADISIIPEALALQVGAPLTGKKMFIIDAHGNTEPHFLARSFVNFPSLNNAGGLFVVALKSDDSDPLIGIDVLKVLGISIDTSEKKLSINNKAWEVFKTLSAVGAIGYLGKLVIDALTTPDDYEES